MADEMRSDARLAYRPRLLARGLLLVTVAGLAVAIVLRWDEAGVDTYAYWYWTRLWLAGGDPYQLEGPALPFVYAPWSLALFAPLAVLPWEMAHAGWRLGTGLGLVASAWWAYRRAPLPTALILAALAVPLGMNLETGNVTLPLGLALFGAQLVDQRLAGLALGVATGMKWVTAPLIFLLDPAGRRWMLAVSALAATASVALLPGTLDQLHSLLRHPRPLPIDYLVLAWPVLPWAIRRRSSLGARRFGDCADVAADGRSLTW